MFLYVSVILLTGWGWYPSMPCSRSPGVSRPTPRRECEGSGLGGPTPSRPTPGGVSRPTPRGVFQAHTRGDLQAHTWWGFPACTEADTSPLTATAADGTHPTGMHSCFLYHQIGLHNYQCNCSHMTTEKTHPCRQVRTDPLGLAINTAMHRRIDTYSQKTSIIS